HPVARVLPAGNANDFYSNVHQNNTAKTIKTGAPKPIDILRLKSKKGGKTFVHYAHSYIGFGLTSEVGRQLNQVKLNRINEVFIALKTTLFLRSTHIIEARQEQAYYSVVVANHRIMSKVLKMSDQSSLDDGKFELVKFKKSSKWLLLKTLFQAATVGLKDRNQAKNYRFKTIKPTMFQIDGEIFEIDGNSLASIRIDKDQLDCLV
ncbi:MAG: hypothetical protein L0H38_01210, partial [bacterium]|nr:hypothetical protein [bacterium]